MDIAVWQVFTSGSRWCKGHLTLESQIESDNIACRASCSHTFFRVSCVSSTDFTPIKGICWMSAVSSYSPSVKLLLLQISSWTTERSSTSPRWRWNTTRIGGGRELLLFRISKGWWWFMMILQTCANYVRCYMQLRLWRASWSNTICNHISAPLLRRPWRDLYSSLAIFNCKPLEAGHAAVWWPELLLGQHGEPRFAGVARDVCHLCVRKTVC